MAAFTVRGGLPGKAQAVPIECGQGGGLVSNVGPNTVYYRDELPVSATVNDGSIASGASATLAGAQYFIVDNGVSSSSADSATLEVADGPPIVTGSRASGAALVSLLAELVSLGLIRDGTSA